MSNENFKKLDGIFKEIKRVYFIKKRIVHYP